MRIVPALKVTRFAQLEPGELFIFHHTEGSCVAIVAADPIENDEKIPVALGPSLPRSINYPSLIPGIPGAVICFGKDYLIRLPVHANGWLNAPPGPEKHCILVTEQGTYIRANFNLQQNPYRECYIDIATGMIFSEGSGPFQRYATPRGSHAFATEWEITTSESEPRVILAYPYPAQHLPVERGASLP